VFPPHGPCFREGQALLTACAGDLELDVYVCLSLNTGRRPSEVSHVRWMDINFRERKALFEPTEEFRNKGMRTYLAPFTQETAERLREWWVKRKGKRYVFAEEGQKPRIHYSRIRRRFKKVVGSIDIRPHTLYDLRRTFGTRMARSGMPRKMLALAMGHINLYTTEKYYVLVDEEDTAEAVRSVLEGRKRA